MTGLTIRRVEPADAEAIARMMGDPTVYPGLMQVPFPGVAAWVERLKTPPVQGSLDLFLIAERDGQAVGSAGLHPVGPSLRRRHVAMLGISVIGPAQGQGVGSALMAALLDYADRWAGVLRVELQVYADNARAMALYRKFGFVPEGTHRAYALRDGVYVDSLSMARLHPQPPGLPT